MNLPAFFAAHKMAVLAGGGGAVALFALHKKNQAGASAASVPALATAQNPATFDTTGTDTASQFGDQLSAYQDWVTSQLDALQANGTAPSTPTQTTAGGTTAGGTTTVATTPAAPRPRKATPPKRPAIVTPVTTAKGHGVKQTRLGRVTAPIRKATPKPKPAAKKKAAPKKKTVTLKNGRKVLPGYTVPNHGHAIPD